MFERRPDRLTSTQCHSILDGVTDAIIVTDSDGRIVYMNPAAATLDVFDGLEPAKHEEWSLLDFVRASVDVRTLEGDPVADDDRPLMRALRGESYRDVELLVRRKDRDQPSMLTFSGTRIEDGQRLGLLTVRDETQRSRAERRYRVAFETDPAPSLIARLDDNRILQANGGMAELAGFDKDELLSLDLAHLKLLGTDGGLHDVRDVLHRGERIHKVQARLLTGGGHEIDVLVSARAIELDGHPCGIFTFLDVTDLEAARREREAARAELAQERERQKVQAERVRAQNLLAERLEKERLRMAQDLHDGVLQNLLALSAELGLDERAHRDAGDVTAAEATRAYRERVLHNVVQLRRDIRGVRPSMLRALGLWPSLRESVPAFARAEGPEIVLPSDKAPHLPEPTLSVVYRVAQEAINNAVKHAEATRVDVTLDVGERELVLRVRDDGRGFDAPQRLSRLAQENHFGLLGMREQASAKGGSLDVLSAPGEGTEIVLRLPVHSRPTRR